MGSALLIDDDLSLLKSIKRAAAANSLSLDTASTWSEGLGLFHVLAPSVVIADYHMPDSQHGLQLLAEIKRLRASVRLVLVSAYINDEDVKRVEGLGIVDRALRKLNPIQTLDEILNEVQRANETRNDNSNWIAFAVARVRASEGRHDELNQLDDFFQKSRTP